MYPYQYCGRLLLQTDNSRLENSRVDNSRVEKITEKSDLELGFSVCLWSMKEISHFGVT